MRFRANQYKHALTEEQLLSEKWVNVVITGRETNYEISDCGRLRHKNKKVILKPSLDKRGYPQCRFYFIDGTPKTKRLHWLVANSFIPNPNNLREINHKDGNKFNNHVSNLERVSSKENKHHSIITGLWRPHGSESSKKKVIDKSTGKVYNSLVEASKNVNVEYKYLSLMLSGCAKNKTDLSYL